MRLVLDPAGSWLVDPEELSKHLDVSAVYLQRQARLGAMRVALVAGSGDDLGLSRVTVCLAGVAWEAVFDIDGAMLRERIC